MGAVKSVAVEIQNEIDLGELTFSEIAVKYGVSLREVDQLALDLQERDLFYNDEPVYPDPDSWYEERYELHDF